MHKQIILMITAVIMGCVQIVISADEWWKPYSPPCTERENVFAFTEKPKVKVVGEDRYEISFAVKGYCDVAVAIVDPRKELVPGRGTVVRHLGAGVLGANAPAPFQKNSLKQVVYWDGKDDLGFYHKEPDKLQVRVMLGLKPVFDKRLGGTSPYNLPGGSWGVAIDESGVYVFAFNGGGFNHGSIRKFSHDGKYQGTLFPPPASFPMDKLSGMGYIEYEPGKRSLHCNDLHDSIAGNGGMLRGLTGENCPVCQVAIAGNKLVYIGLIPGTEIFYVYTDGSTDIRGASGIKIGRFDERQPVMLASSPDGHWVYITSLRIQYPHAVIRVPVDGSKPHEVFIGKDPGSDNMRFNSPRGIDTDTQGRIYVADSNNNRIQIFSSDGKYLKTIPVSGPRLVRVHQKTGAIYVQHSARVEGKSVVRLTKYKSFDEPVAEFFVDGIGGAVMAVDSWTPRARLWICGIVSMHHEREQFAPSVRVYEEEDKKFRLVLDFEEEAKKEAGANYIGWWAADCFDKMVCDPVREQAYYRNSVVFDLVSGRKLGVFSPALHCVFDDMTFDKHGYAHLHFNPCFFGQGVGRVDPSRMSESDKAEGRYRYPECPYDYGVESHGWKGILPTKDQNGAKGFQDGIGANMRGDVASVCNIYYAPKMEDEAVSFALAGDKMRLARGVWSEEYNSYNAWMRQVEDAMRRGEEVYFIKRMPGVPIIGGTVWTYKRTGELWQDCAVIAGDLINGVQIDEDGAIYFVNSRPKAYNEKPFLYGRGGILGGTAKAHPFTGTLIRTKAGEKCRVLLANAVIKMEPLPSRPPDLLALDYMDEAYMGKGSWCWVENAEWIYAGAGPITSVGCSCPRQHLGLDWYKRVYLPEAYRHSIGILDTNGNLIMHLGRYGNFDDAPGGKNGAGAGGEDIGMLSVRFISATDNYLVYSDWSEKIIVLKLAYHVEESVQIPGK
jgi:hypothetical protein